MSQGLQEPSQDALFASGNGDPRVQLIHRILTSVCFRNAARQRELLCFLAKETLEGRGDQLHEQLIGCSVFGREPGYSSNEDNIVRVQMRQLRIKLDQYFAEEGAGEALAACIPKGSYVMRFAEREVPREQESNHSDTVAKQNPKAVVWRRWATGVAATLVLVVGVLAAVHYWAETQARTVTAVSNHPLFSNLFDAAHPTHVVVADSSLELLLTITQHSGVTLDDYLRHDYSTLYKDRGPDLRSALEIIASRQATSIVDASVAAKLLRLSGEQGPRVSIKFSRDLQLRDLKLSHAILLGSKRSNPWVQLFEPFMNFSIQFDNGPVVHNRVPRPGEMATYRGSRTSSQVEDYSIVAFLPNLNHDGNVLIIAGTSMNATEAAGEFITEPARSGAFLDSLIASRAASSSGASTVPYFELLLKTSAMAGVAKGATVVTHRLINP